MFDRTWSEAWRTVAIATLLFKDLDKAAQVDVRGWNRFAENAGKGERITARTGNP